MANWFKKIFSPKNVVTFEDVYGHGHHQHGSHFHIGSHTAMAQPAVYACVNLISWVVSSLPIMLIDRDTGKKALDETLYRVLSIKPNKFQTSFELRDMQLTSLLLYGVSYSRKYKNALGEVIAIVPLHWEQVSLEFDTQRQDIKFHITYIYGTGTNARTTSETVYSDSMMVIRGKHSDIMTPVSPIAAQARNIATSEVLADHKYNFFGINAAKPGGVIEAEGRVDEAVAKKILGLFNARYASSRNSGKTILLEQALKFKPLQMTNTDSQFLELCRFSVEDICKIYNVPPSLIHQNDHSTYSNAVQQSLSFLKFTLLPYLEMLEQVYIRDIFTEEEFLKFKIRFDVSNLLKGDNESTANYLVKLVQGGLMTPNEGREYLGLYEMPGEASNKLYIQQNQIAVDQIDEANAARAAKAATPPAAPETGREELVNSSVIGEILQFESELNKYLGGKKDVV